MIAKLALWACAVVAGTGVALGQSAVDQAAPGLSNQRDQVQMAAGISRDRGTDQTSSIQWVRLILRGKTVMGQAGSIGPPLLVAQCTLAPNTRYKFEVLASFGDAADLAFYPPWKPHSASDLFPPDLQKLTLTMEFLGYTHVKPLRRQFEVPLESPGLFRYSAPGRRSSNLEEIAYDLRYLLALPTMRLSSGQRAAEFETASWLAAIRTEPLCRAAGL